jgi:hypothetical protein
MELKSFTKKIFCCAVFAASVLTANAAIDVSRLMIVGGSVWCGYSIDNSIVLSNAKNTGLYKATVYISNEGDGFKFLTYAGWGGELCPESNDIAMESGVEYKLCVNNGADNKFKVKESANYDIVCDVENEIITVTKAAYQKKNIKYTGLWIIGEATPGGWSISDGIAMAQDDANPFKFTATVDLNAGELKFAINNHTGFGQTFFVRDIADDGKMVFGGDDNKWTIDEAGKYDIAVDVDELTVSIKKSTASSIGSVEAADDNTHAEYFTLGGVKANSVKVGDVYVKRLGGKTVKVIAQ